MNHRSLIEGPLSTTGGGFGCAISPSLSDSDEGTDYSSDNCSFDLGSDCCFFSFF